MKSFFTKIGDIAGVFAERFIPDSWIYAIVLTFIAFIAAVTFTSAGVWQTAVAWQNGFWNSQILLLIAKFSINLMLCATLAHAPFVEGILNKLARIPKTSFSAIWLIAFVSIGLSLISWALCIIGGALFAQFVCRQAALQKIKLHYPLAIASGYVGMLTWGSGLTSSAALISSTPGHFMESLIGVIPTADTLGSTTNLLIVGLLALFCPLLLAAMHPVKKVIEFSTENDSKDSKRRKPKTFAEKVEQSPVFLKLAAILPISFFVSHYIIQGKGLTIDSMNLAFLVAVMLLYKTPKQMLNRLASVSSSVWPIVFQFPFYAGLMGLIKTTGLGLAVAEGFSTIATPLTWPAIGVLFQGIINVFIPSGGSQWIVSGEILVKTSQALGYSNAQAIMIEIMGDQLTNMIQPMWALPALALAGLQARNIMGYTSVVMVVAFFIMSICLTLFPA